MQSKTQQLYSQLTGSTNNLMMAHLQGRNM